MVDHNSDIHQDHTGDAFLLFSPCLQAVIMSIEQFTQTLEAASKTLKELSVKIINIIGDNVQ